MLKNIEVIRNFINDIPCRNGNLISTEGRLFTYNTCLAQKHNNVIIVNMTKYSQTSSRHRNMLLCELSANRLPTLEVDDIQINTLNLVNTVLLR